MNDLLLLAQETGGGMMTGGLFLLMLILGLLAFIVWIWALISAIKNPALDSTMRIIWVLVIVITGIVGAIIYLLVGDRTRAGTPGP